MLVPLKKILPLAVKKRFALGAFNTANLEITLGIIRAAQAQRSPMIIQVSESTIKYAGLETIVRLIEEVDKSQGGKTPIALHLDHGRSLETVVACIKAGFSSVHRDASELPFADNVKETRKAAEYAHRHGVLAQGELGSLLGQEGLTKIKMPANNDYMTDPEMVPEFIAKTGVDTLAVSVGTMHGLFKGQENIDFERLTLVAKKAKLPLVLHGASGVAKEQIRQAIKGGIRIINIDTELRAAFTETLRRTLKQEKAFYDPRKILTPSIESVQKTVEQKTILFGSAHQVK